MRHVALYGLDEVRDEVEAALELNVDVRERLLGAVTQGYEPVVRPDEPERDDAESDIDPK